MNVLLTSVGRRSYLAKYFRDALQGRGRVVATNTDQLSPGMVEADAAEVVMPSYDGGYVDQLLDVCRRHDIGLICSLHDLDGLILSKYRDAFVARGIMALVPTYDWAVKCLDKGALAEDLSVHGFDTPWQTCSLDIAREALRMGGVSFPLVVKARHGFGSLGLSTVTSLEDLNFSYRRCREAVAHSVVSRFVDVNPDETVLIQGHIEGAEHCVEVLNDYDGNYVCNYACRVHLMRAGESERATTVSSCRYQEMAKRFSQMTSHQGLWEVDVIAAADGRDYIIEVNPRFSGDYPFNHLAGANVPAILLAWLKGEVPDPRWFKTEVGVTGYKDLVPRRMNAI